MPDRWSRIRRRQDDQDLGCDAHVIAIVFYTRFSLALLLHLKSSWIRYFVRLEPELEYLDVWPGDTDSTIDMAA
jgi:hypothetical protein